MKILDVANCYACVFRLELLKISNHIFSLKYTSSWYKVKISASFKRFLKIVGLSFLLGLVIINVEFEYSGLYQFGMVLILVPLVLILPIARTLLWNLFGEEYLSFSSKSVVQQLNYGIVILPPETYLFNRRLNYKFENRRIVNDTQEVQIHFFSYDEMDQPVYTKLKYILAQSMMKFLILLR